MLDDQYTLDHLAFARDMRQHFLDSEWTALSEHEEPPGTEVRPKSASQQANSGRTSFKDWPRGAPEKSADMDVAPLGRFDLDRRQAQRISAQPRAARVFAYALAGLLLLFSLSGPLLSNANPNAPLRPVAAWQAR